LNTVKNAEKLRAYLPEVVEKVKRGARSTVLYRSQPAFQLVPAQAAELERDTIYHAPAVGHSTDGQNAANHDSILY
jgi:antitoxin (DNA-binding transcriptional repressor) of toxin-antitoxin stability system